MKLFQIATATIIGTLLICAVGAEAAPTTNRIAVAYGDLNLASPKGIETLKHRIKNAASRICGPEPDLRNLALSKAYGICVAQSMREAMNAAPVAVALGESGQ